MLVLGVLLLVAFAYWETVYSHPLMPPHIWKDRNFTLVCGLRVVYMRVAADSCRSS